MLEILITKEDYMSEKKLFPGVTEQEIAERKQAILAEQKRIDAEKQIEKLKKEEAKRTKERMEMYKRYMTTPSVTPIPLSKTIKDIAKASAVVAVATFGLGNFWYCFWGLDDEIELGHGNFTTNENQTPYKEALRDAYWPVANGKFNPTIGWGANVLIAVLTAIGAGKKIQKDKQINKTIATERTAIDTMVTLQKLPQNVELYHLTENQMKCLTSVAKSIISEMSSEYRIYFDMIIEGKINAENKKDMLSLATTIMEGHLSQHPEDINKVLEVFNEHSVPEHLFAKYKKYIK